MDDVLCVGEAKLSEWEAYFQFFSKFSKAFGLIINTEKSKIIYDVGAPEDIIQIVALFVIKIRPLFVSFKYLGFNLKPSKYEIVDWSWLVKKIEKKLTTSDHKCSLLEVGLR